MNEEEKIKEILASLDTQLQVDAIRIIEQNNIANKEENVKALTKAIILKKKDKYPKDEEKIQEEKKKYSESFKGAIEEEKTKKRKEEERIRKIIKTYEKSIIKKQDISRLYERQIITKSQDIPVEENKKTFFKIIKELFMRKTINEKVKSKETEETIGKTIDIKEQRQQFVKGLEPKCIIQNTDKEKKNIIKEEKIHEK